MFKELMVVKNVAILAEEENAPNFALLKSCICLRCALLSQKFDQIYGLIGSPEKLEIATNLTSLKMWVSIQHL